ncbi:MAG TPA: SAM-dependent methyltransferase [Gammaproteobacteria bacterium]|nr:SAM-dependent methyltransferase [Gammaproteobacteria bacterium]
MKTFITLLLYVSCMLLAHAAADQSINPGINKHYEGARYEEWVRIFESPGREIYDRRQDIVNALDLKPDMNVADIGAGTGFFTHMFARLVGPKGLVYAVDITPDFIANIKRTSREQELTNVKTILNNERDAMLPENSIDLAFLCDTYHHFEYPQSMLTSIYRALKPGSELIVIDYRKIAGRSNSWVMSHVRADRAQVISEIEAAGFDFKEEKEFLVSNYFLRFTRLHHMVPGGTVDADK